MKAGLKNIDYLSTDIPDQILEQLFYSLESITISPGTYLFKKGTSCTCLYLISSGDLDILIGADKTEKLIDTLYENCIIGTYYSITGDEYSISARANTECTVLKLPFELVSKFRLENEALDEAVCKCEEYIVDNDLPYCDYKLYRGDTRQISPLQKFKNGIRRIMRIVSTYKASAFTELLLRAQRLVREK